MNINNTAEKLFRFDLHALPSGKFNFLKIDPEDLEPRAELCLPDLTETEVRQAYATKLGLKLKLSETEIDNRLSAARQQLEAKRTTQ